MFSQTFDQHLKHLKEAFKILVAANLKIKPKKCQFFKDQLEYLKFFINKDGLRPHPEKIEVIQKKKFRTISKIFKYFWA